MNIKIIEAALEEADALLKIAHHAHSKMGLEEQGSNVGYSHEVRMFALEFSQEGRDGPGELQVRGTGRFWECVMAIKAALHELEDAS